VGWWLWYLPMLGAVVLAYVYARWTNRTRGPQEPNESVQAYERFRQVMAAPTPTQRSRQSAEQRGKAPSSGR
jgi:hypothetical protein